MIERRKSPSRIEKNRTKRNNIIMINVLVVILGLGVYFGSYYYYSRKNEANVKVGRKDSDNNNESTKSDKADQRESTVIADEPSTDPSKVNIYAPDGNKMAYITFDDGPSENITPEILNILDKYNVKATFFIVGSMATKYPDLVKEEYDKGHAIGNHTYSHNYKYIYSDVNTFIEDVNKDDMVLKSIIGTKYESKLVRFPGGSFGVKMKPFRDGLTKAGYHYVDWNDLTGDAEEKNVTVDKLLSNLKKYTENKEHVVILMHDAPDKTTTAEALPMVIEYLKSQGYSFGKLK
ncbi:MAG: polysaccharide deacetylase family protein [Solirubrobacterales bacterium]